MLKKHIACCQISIVSIQLPTGEYWVFDNPSVVHSLAGQLQQGWEFEIINRFKEDVTQFNKRPIREHLEYYLVF